MTPDIAPISKGQLLAGRTLSGLVILFLLFDAGCKLVPIQPVINSMRDLGFSTDVGLARAIGLILLISTLLYAIPRTTVLGAVLLTGYLGGAVAINLRLGYPLPTHVLFPVYFGVLLWGGLFLRSRTVRAAFLP